MFNYRWSLQNANFTKNKGTVFSCFACGGGSTMGYKLAGFDVLGCNEIDPKMNKAYVANHKPKFNYLEPIQSFKLREDLPKELYELDILDGSPPCSSFSMSGNRGDDWGKEKKFKEGQSKQVLDTLFFDFIDLAKKLQPKIVVAENVKGLLLGDAINYVRKIYDEFDKVGYIVQHWLLDSSTMGVPQKRERVFFIALRKDLCQQFLTQIDMFTFSPKIVLDFKLDSIRYSEIEDKNDHQPNITEIQKKWWLLCSPGQSFSEIHPKGHWFNSYKIHPNDIVPTILAGHGNAGSYHYEIPRTLNTNEYLMASTFPSDYDFAGNNPKYIMGMSVPPVMVAQIAHQIYEQWISKL